MTAWSKKEVGSNRRGGHTGSMIATGDGSASNRAGSKNEMRKKDGKNQKINATKARACTNRRIRCGFHLLTQELRSWLTTWRCEEREGTGWMNGKDLPSYV